MITEEQRQRRKSGLFSSDVARIMTGHGVQVALHKLGRMDEEDLSEVVEINIGQKAESLVLDAYEEQSGQKLERNIDTLIHPVYPWLGCHQDARATKNSVAVNVEAKTVGFYNRQEWGDGGDEVPDYVLWQVQQQMAVSGCTVTDIPVCFISNQSLKYLFLDQTPPITVFQVQRDYQLEEYMIEKAENVWQCIQRGETPDPKTLDDIKLIYPRALDAPVEATLDIELEWGMLLEVRKTRKWAEKEEADRKLKIQEFMKASEAVILQRNGQTLATWKNDPDGEKFDQKRFAQEHPELYKRYLINKPGARKFLLKTPKE